MFIKHGMGHYVLKLYKVYINDDPVLTLTHCNTMSNLAKLVFVHKVGPNIRQVFTGTLVIWFSSREQKAAMSLKFSLRSRPSVAHQYFFQTSSTLKPLSQSKPNFMWRLYGSGNEKIYK